MRFLTVWTLLGILLGTYLPTHAQLPWRKRAKMAAALEKSGDLNQAAIYYRGVFEEKPDKEEYSYKAGHCFLEFRDYANAVQCLEVVKDQNDHPKYDKPGFKYALALKQTGQAQKAKEAFNTFLVNYQGEDKETYREVVENEIKGCNYALKALNYTDPTVQIEHLDAKVNSAQTEFAPIPFANNVLYFSSTKAGVAKIYRSVQQPSGWARPQVPSIFEGKMKRPHFGNGTFTQDGTRFYFTQCDIAEDRPQCAIFMMENLGNGQWSDPVLLPDYVNPPDANTTHPLVVDQGGLEVLYFVSNRAGGRGGLDLWYTTCPKGGDINSFTLPKNLGRNINSTGDEISPFYHQATGTLYFSSNGRVSAGGLDIFKSKGNKLQWEVAQNLGFPINSAADDLYYVISEAHGGGYLVSNRPFESTRSSTTDDDIFYFGVETVELSLKGSIVDARKEVGAPLRDVAVQLFQKTEEGGEELLEERLLAIGTFSFEGLEPNTEYILSVLKDGYNPESYTFKTAMRSKEEQRIVQLYPSSEQVVQLPVDAQAIRYYIIPEQHNSNNKALALPVDPIDPKTGIAYTGDTLKIYYELDAIAGLGDQRRVYYKDGQPQPYHEPMLGAELSAEDYPEVPGPYSQSAITAKNVVYKIQVSAVRKFKAYKYEDLKEIGRLTTEEIEGGLKRILVINKEQYKGNEEGYKRKSDALNALSYILNNSGFEYAFVIKYVNGTRVGEGFRGWDEAEGLKTNSQPDGYIPEDSYEGF